MFGHRVVRRVGLVALVVLLSSPVAQSWAGPVRQGGAEAPRSSMLGTEGGLRGLWHLLVRMLFADGDNRGTLDPNG